MKKLLATTSFLALFLLVGCTSTTVSEGSVECVTDADCVVFGESGDCNCGCYNKDNLPSGTGGECFCAAPTGCECVNSECEGLFSPTV